MFSYLGGIKEMKNNSKNILIWICCIIGFFVILSCVIKILVIFFIPLTILAILSIPIIILVVVICIAIWLFRR